MDWDIYIKDYRSFLILEKSLSTNTVKGYINDIEKLVEFLEHKKYDLSPNDIEYTHLQEFLKWLNRSDLKASTQGRIVNEFKSFFKYLWIGNVIKTDPSNLLEYPTVEQKLPDCLNLGEINAIIDAIDMSKPEGQRNKAMLETMYSCGLRVSELVNLKLSELFFNEGFVRIIGKGNKERMIPIGRVAMAQINAYQTDIRSKYKIKHGNEDFLFLSRRGMKITRDIVFDIIKDLAAKCGITKRVSPHVFRHSFATHLVEGGADLSAVQAMLGHASITTTEIYAQLDKKQVRSEVLRFHPRS
ncbi:MAG: site-specific tyrosine recombinase [Bacteroidota bacterium]